MSDIFYDYAEDDINVIKKQLNTEAVNITGIVERCKWGYPSIILLYPFRRTDGENYPQPEPDYLSISTLIWLTCPYLNDKIHTLESRGLIKKISHLIYRNREYIDMMRFAHAHYYYLRKNVYRHFLGEVSSLDENSSLFSSGIGGISNIDTIKCLHLHYAHYRLCRENLTGRITYALLDEDINCDNVICANS